MRQACQNREENLGDCGCTYPGCPRKGICCECIRHHRKRGEIPGCLFPTDAEKTHDRSLERFLESTKE